LYWPALIAAMTASGCATLADRIVEPHSRAQLDGRAKQSFEQTLGVTHATWRSPQGVTLAYRMIPAATRGMRYAYARNANRYAFHFNADMAAAKQAPSPPVRGTVVYLHGWEMDGSSMLGWALALADRGYDGIAVDLRNNGDSSRAPAGFGPREAGDVVAFVDALRARGAVHEPVHLFGVSYGAATALFAEAGLRGQVAGIVAMEPYANAADAIRTPVPGMLDMPAQGVGERLLTTWARSRYTPAATERAIAEADRRLGIDLASVDLHAPLAQSKTCTLLLHGTRDHFIPVAASRDLAAAAPRAHYTELPLETHMTLPLRVDWLADPLSTWLTDAAAGRCEPLVLPVDPAKDMSTVTTAAVAG
jgi:pimeloyl-ACP methyl ester carboxylesterase